MILLEELTFKSETEVTIQDFRARFPPALTKQVFKKNIKVPVNFKDVFVSCCYSIYL